VFNPCRGLLIRCPLLDRAQRDCLVASDYLRGHQMAISPHHLGALNPSQRAAAKYGGAGLPHEIPGPLLIIAGAGTGKTNTLAHRVGHLIVRGADARRILLLTFTRRAAATKTRRAGLIAGQLTDITSRRACLRAAEVRDRRRRASSTTASTACGASGAPSASTCPKAGGWRSIMTVKRSYHQADEAGVLEAAAGTERSTIPHRDTVAVVWVENSCGPAHSSEEQSRNCIG
jgi:hypothetical protein